MELKRFEMAERFAAMWRKVRADAGVSQDYVAKTLGVSKKTVQNWEAGTSCPNQMMAFELFIALNLQPLPYYLELLYPEEFVGIDAKNSSDEQVEEALIELIRASTPDEKRKLLFWAAGAHGSSRHCVLEMITAHLLTPLHDRVSTAQLILTNYEMAEATGKVPEQSIRPDTDFLQHAIDMGKDAVLQGKEGYTALVGNRMTSV